MTENILVTGGAGYIGSHIVRDLGETGKYFPIVYDDLSTGVKENILYGEFIKGNTGDKALLTRIIQKYKIKSVFHFAASIVVSESVVNPLKYYLNNTANALNLIQVCLENGVGNFIFSSTAAVYGIPEKIPASEDNILAPINPYGMSKMFTEKILIDTAKANPNFNFIALRYFNVAGADSQGRIGQNYKKPTHLITLALRTALGLIPELNIYGTDYNTPDGTAIRDYIHIDDLASAHLLALNYLREKKTSTIFNCGYAKGFSVLEVVNQIKEITGMDFKVNLSERREGDPPSLIASNSLIKEKLNWKPEKANLSVILKSALNWEKKLHRI
jgi:UDP-glucose 4-epimerase